MAASKVPDPDQSADQDTRLLFATQLRQLGAAFQEEVSYHLDASPRSQARSDFFASLREQAGVVVWRAFRSDLLGEIDRLADLVRRAEEGPTRSRRSQSPPVDGTADSPPPEAHTSNEGLREEDGSVLNGHLASNLFTDLVAGHHVEMEFRPGFLEETRLRFLPFRPGDIKVHSDSRGGLLPRLFPGVFRESPHMRLALEGTGDAFKQMQLWAARDSEQCALACSWLADRIDGERQRRTPSLPDTDEEGLDRSYPVDLTQMTAISGLSKKTLQRRLKAQKLPAPDIPGRPGVPHRWYWSRIRGPLSELSKRILPLRFPADTLLEYEKEDEDSEKTQGST